MKEHYLLSMHAKYEVSITHGSKVIVKVKVDNRQTDKQTGQKKHAPDHWIQGHKNSYVLIGNTTVNLSKEF